MIEGIININKDRDWTSFDVVAKLRRLTGIKKMGHTGTLDPLATGVLPVAIGRATKLVDMLTDKVKEYEALLLLGVETDTYDISGMVLQEKPCSADRNDIEAAAAAFLGDILQKPPMYSAIKVEGKKLCDMAREGHRVEVEPRPVTIYSITIEEINLPRVRMKVVCSKGTYIRSLCHDIGELLGCGGCMQELTRIRSGIFTLENSHTVEQVEEYINKGELEKIILPVDSFFEEYPRVVLQDRENSGTAEITRSVANGNPLFMRDLRALGLEEKPHYVRVYNHNMEFMALYYLNEGRRMYQPRYMFGPAVDGGRK